MTRLNKLSNNSFGVGKGEELIHIEMFTFIRHLKLEVTK